MAVRCTSHPLPRNASRLRVAVSVSNNTGSTRRAIVYGPALTGVTFIHPFLRTEEVVVVVGGARRSYPGWVIPRVQSKTPARVVFHMTHPARSASILASTGPVVHASSWDLLRNTACTVG
jgi:hypothetical protein